MNLSESSNPTLNRKIFETNAFVQTGETMTVSGAVNKCIIMALLVFASAAFSWNLALKGTNVMPLMIGGIIGGLITALVTVFKKEWSAITAPLYALLEGLVLGVISVFFAAMYAGIILKAITLTFGILFALLFAYKSGLIKATEKFKLGVIAATGGVAIFYFIQMIMGWFGVNTQGLFYGGTIGIVISLAIVVVAALNLVLDFAFIEEGAQAQAPKYMEWYAAFGLMVTLIWLYLEILKLLSLVSGRRN